MACATEENSDEGILLTAGSTGPKGSATRIRKARHTTRDKPIAVAAGSDSLLAVHCVCVMGHRCQSIGLIRFAVICYRQDALKVSLLLRQGRKRHLRRGRAGITKAAVVAIEEELVLPPRQRNQRATQIDAVFVVVLDRLDRYSGVGLPPQRTPMYPEMCCGRTRISSRDRRCRPA